MHGPITGPRQPPALPASPVTFSGERTAFLRLVFRGALLELVTLGFYRFWLATDIRRHLWSHTAIAGDPVEYSGRAKELLIGFLIAMAILLPLYVVYFIAGLEAELVQVFASIPLILIAYLFTEFARYRARRYRVTRTVWRGLRLSMGGSGVRYSLCAGLWTLLAIVTLGLALPWRQAALERYKMRHTAYGSLNGRFDGTGGELFKRGWLLWVLAVPAAMSVVGLPFLYATYKAIEWRWWVSGVRFGAVLFESNLKRGSLIGVYWKVVAWTGLLSILLSLWISALFAAGLAMASGAENVELAVAAAMQHPALLIGMALGYLLLVLGIGVAQRLYLNRDVWAKVAVTTAVYNLSAADNVTGQGAAVSAVGEGLADSLDIGGF